MSDTTVTNLDIRANEISVIRPGTRPDLPEDPRQSTVDRPEPSEAVRNFRVALVTMPFGPCWSGSAQIGLLKPLAQRAGFPVDDFYFNVELAAEIGVQFYTCISEQHTTYTITGEWLFSVAAFGDKANHRDYFAIVPHELEKVFDAVGKDLACLNDMRERVLPRYLDDCLEKVDWGAYGAVGFTSTFQQHVAALGLAQRIKARFPHVKIIFGGSNMDGEMGVEWVRAFPCIDFGVIGEGDAVFPELLTRLAEGGPTDAMMGVATRTGEQVAFLGAAPLFRDLENSPTPDYTTYFETAGRFRLSDDPGMRNLPCDSPIEGSRGCWWGAKQHCTFCNLNDDVMPYRGRSAQSMRRVLDELHANHGAFKFWATDAIMDWRVIGPLLTQLADEGSQYEFSFFNLKANMTREQIRILRRGGLFSMQAGVESLSTRVLKLMRKGCTKLQNLTCLKWSRYYGIRCGWNILHGFPGEREEDYEDQLETLRLITHFNPPDHRIRVVHLQFSPLFYDDQLYPKKWRRPSPCYSYVYPEHVNIDRVACVFDCELEDTLPEEVHEPTKGFVDEWRDLWEEPVTKPSLTYRRAESDIVIHDARFGPARPRTFTLLGPDADIYEAFGSAPRTPGQVVAAYAAECPGLLPDEVSVRNACEDLCEAGLMVGDGGKYLSLALPADPEV